MHLHTSTLALLLCSSQVLALPGPALSPSGLVSYQSTRTASSSTPTVTLAIANPTISGIFQMGLNDGLQNICLGHNSTVPSFVAANSTSTVPLSEEIPAITTTGKSPSTVTEVYTEVYTQTAYAKETTVSAVIDILTFAYASNTVNLGAWKQQRAEPTQVTIKETQTATETAIIQEVTRTAVIYLLIPASTNGPATLLASPPSLAQEKPASAPENQTIRSEPQKAELVDAYKAGFVIGEGMQNPCHEGRLPPGSAVYVPKLKTLGARGDIGSFLNIGDPQNFVRRSLERRRGGGGGGGGHGGGSGGRSSGSGSGSGSARGASGSGADGGSSNRGVGKVPPGTSTSGANARTGLLPAWTWLTLVLVVSFVAAGATLRPLSPTNGSTAFSKVPFQAAALSDFDTFNKTGPEPAPGQINFFGPRQVDSMLNKKAQAAENGSSKLEKRHHKSRDTGCSSCINAAVKDQSMSKVSTSSGSRRSAPASLRLVFLSFAILTAYLVSGATAVGISAESSDLPSVAPTSSREFERSNDSFSANEMIDGSQEITNSQDFKVDGSASNPFCTDPHQPSATVESGSEAEEMNIKIEKGRSSGSGGAIGALAANHCSAGAKNYDISRAWYYLVIMAWAMVFTLGGTLRMPNLTDAVDSTNSTNQTSSTKVVRATYESSKHLSFIHRGAEQGVATLLEKRKRGGKPTKPKDKDEGNDTCTESECSTSHKTNRASLIWMILPVLVLPFFVLPSFIPGAVASSAPSDDICALFPVDGTRTPSCAGLHPLPLLSPAPSGEHPNNTQLDPSSLQVAEQAEGFPITARGATGMEYPHESGTTCSSVPTWTLLFFAFVIVSMFVADASGTDVQDGEGKHTILQNNPGVVQWSSDSRHMCRPFVNWAVISSIVVLLLSILPRTTARSATADTPRITELIDPNITQDGNAVPGSTASGVPLSDRSHITSISNLKVLLLLPIAWVLGYCSSRHPRYRYLCSFGLIASILLVQGALAIALPIDTTPALQPPSQSSGLSLHNFNHHRHNHHVVHRATIHQHIGVTPQGISAAQDDAVSIPAHEIYRRQGTLSQEAQQNKYFLPVIAVLAGLFCVWLLAVLVVWKIWGKNMCSPVLCSCPSL